MSPEQTERQRQDEYMALAQARLRSTPHIENNEQAKRQDEYMAGFQAKQMADMLEIAKASQPGVSMADMMALAKASHQLAADIENSPYEECYRKAEESLMRADEAAAAAKEVDRKLTRHVKKTYKALFTLLLLSLVLSLLILLLTAVGVAAAPISKDREPKPVSVEVSQGVYMDILVEAPTGEPMEVELLDVDGYASGCDAAGGWSTGYKGTLLLTFSPVTNDASVLVTLPWAPEMGDPVYDLVDGSQSLTREEWLGIVLATDQVYQYVAAGANMPFDNKALDGVLAAHEYLFQESCILVGGK